MGDDQLLGIWVNLRSGKKVVAIWDGSIPDRFGRRPFDGGDEDDEDSYVQ
jgi:hypothetical protein